MAYTQPKATLKGLFWLDIAYTQPKATLKGLFWLDMAYTQPKATLKGLFWLDIQPKWIKPMFSFVNRYRTVWLLLILAWGANYIST
jgi:hypothetical protein